METIVLQTLDSVVKTIKVLSKTISKCELTIQLKRTVNLTLHN